MNASALIRYRLIHHNHCRSQDRTHNLYDISFHLNQQRGDPGLELSPLTLLTENVDCEHF